MQELIDTILHFPPALFTLITLGGFWSSLALFLMISRTTRRALVQMWMVFSNQLYWVCFGWIHAQQVSHELGIIKGQCLLLGLISHRAVMQAQTHLKVAAELFNLDKELMNWNPAGLFQCISYVVFEGVTCIVPEHLLKVKHDTVTERVPCLGGSLWVHDAI